MRASHVSAADLGSREEEKEGEEEEEEEEKEELFYLYPTMLGSRDTCVC